MLIGSRYSDNKLYRGLKHYDQLPLTSGDLHEYYDILQKKNAYLTNNLLGSGLLNSADVSISTTGIKLNSPAVVLLDGDIILIQADSDIVSKSDIASSSITDGVLCVVGWYQHLDTSSTLRAYGGVNNTTLTNDIIDSDLSVQVSTRYQFRWDTVIMNRSTVESSSAAISFSLLNRAATGALGTGSTSITTVSKSGDIRIANKPSSMTYAVSSLYIIPILKFTYSSNSITAATSCSRLRVTSPTLVQYTRTIDVPSVLSTASNLTVSIGMNNYEVGDILQVLYEDILLTKDVHYTLDTTNRSITLLGFTTKSGEKITFILTKAEN